MLSPTFGMVGAVVARSPARREVCDRATAELQDRTSLHSCFLPPWIPMRTTFSFPSSSSPGSPPLCRRHKPPPRFKSEALLSLNVDLKGNFDSLSIGAEMRTSPPHWQ